MGGRVSGSLHLLTGTPKTTRPLGSIALHCSALPDEGRTQTPEDCVTKRAFKYRALLAAEKTC